MERFYLTGNTYPVKDRLKELGCKYDPERKAWYATAEDVRAEAQKEIDGQSGKGESRPFRHLKCQVCGEKASRYVKILRSGECFDCYEERKMGY